MFEPDAPEPVALLRALRQGLAPGLTEGRPKAGRGVKSDLLGTTRRRNGDRQVTYAGKPLYTYAHEGPGEVLCHDVRLNGGLWWVLSPAGAPRP